MKSLCGLEQTPKQWHENFHNATIASGVESTNAINVFISNILRMDMLFCVYILTTCSLFIVMAGWSNLWKFCWIQE